MPRDRRRHPDHSLANTLEKIKGGFFRPAITLLLQLSEHCLAGVRVYSILLLVDLAAEHMYLFDASMLADIAFRLKVLRETDPDRQVRSCAKANLGRLLHFAAEYVAACKVESLPPPEATTRPCWFRGPQDWV